MKKNNINKEVVAAVNGYAEETEGLDVYENDEVIPEDWGYAINDKRIPTYCHVINCDPELPDEFVETIQIMDKISHDGLFYAIVESNVIMLLKNEEAGKEQLQEFDENLNEVIYNLPDFEYRDFDEDMAVLMSGNFCAVRHKPEGFDEMDNDERFKYIIALRNDILRACDDNPGIYATVKVRR